MDNEIQKTVQALCHEPEKINMIIAQMTILMTDNEHKVKLMENQKWYQRMIFTVFGKNKATVEEIQNNRERLNAYMAQCLSALYDQKLINDQILISLGNQIRALLTTQIKMKYMLGEFVEKLNQKIESVDRFGMMCQELSLGHYSAMPPMEAVFRILSQLDLRTLSDKRKLDIIEQHMKQQGILNESEQTLRSMLEEFAKLPLADIGCIYLELESIRDSFMADLYLRVLENYCLLPEEEKQFKDVQRVIDAIEKQCDLVLDQPVTSKYIYSQFVQAKVRFASTQIQAHRQHVNAVVCGCPKTGKTTLIQAIGRACAFHYTVSQQGSVTMYADMASGTQICEIDSHVLEANNWECMVGILTQVLHEDSDWLLLCISDNRIKESEKQLLHYVKTKHPRTHIMVVLTMSLNTENAVLMEKHLQHEVGTVRVLPVLAQEYQSSLGTVAPHGVEDVVRELFIDR